MAKPKSEKAPQPAYLIALCFILARCTRGANGIIYVCRHIAKNWELFASDFPAYCVLLVAYAESVCLEKGKTFLSHVEGLHTGLSGLQFLRTLKGTICRKKLVLAAIKLSLIFERVLRARGRRALTSAEVMEIGGAFHKGVVLAIHNGILRTISNYNEMDATRCFECLVNAVFGVPPTIYDDSLHCWYMKRQKKKMRAQVLKDMKAIGVTTAREMQEKLKVFQSLVSGTVNASTGFVALCEFRQLLNKFGLRRVHLMVQACEKSTDIQKAVAVKRRELFETGGTCECHTVQLFNVIAGMGKFGNAAPQCTVAPSKVLDAMVGAGLCPKVALDGIPEFASLQKSFPLLVALALGRSINCKLLAKACASIGCTPRSAGARKSKRRMMNMLSKGLHEGYDLVTKSESTHKALEKRMISLGGNVRPYIGGKRTRLSATDMKNWIATKGGSTEP